MDSNVSTNSESDGASDSAELIKAFLEYMRTPTPELNDAENAGQFWILGSNSEKPWISPASSSPVLACPPSWLETGQEYGDPTHDTEEDAEDVRVDVPLSSSPPDLASSSPQSAASETSEDALTSCSSLSPGHFAYEAPVREADSSLADLRTENTGNNFGQRLHDLLLAAAKERERDLEADYADSLSGAEPSECGSSTSSSGYVCSGVGSEHGEDSRYSGNALVSPVVFELSRQSSTKRSFSETQSQDAAIPSPITVKRYTKRHCGLPVDPALTYRLIKRAQSYEASRDDKNEYEPVSKRQKVFKDQGTHTKDRIYAHRAASLRRAESLKSVSGKSPVVHELAPTVPATPVATTPRASGRNCTKASDISRVLMSPVPIIAPPEDHVAKLPLNAETLAKMRLSRYLERESNDREMDGLPAGPCQRPPSWMVNATICEGMPLVHEENSWTDDVVVEWEVFLGIGKKRREAAINWILDVLPIKAPGRASSPVAQSPSSQTSRSTDSYYCWSSSCSSQGLDTPDVSGDSRPIYNLQDQLETSPETRFHAVWMLLRYLYLTMSPASDYKSKSGVQSSRGLSKSNSIDQSGLTLVVWDIAVACLAISVKFHRDFLHPLLPVFADEYVHLAPHAISLEDLESAHRDILSAFDYRLGVTPQPVMEQLWLALPSLRALLDFPRGWANATSEAWSRLFAVLDEPDIQRFLVSELTVVALMDGIIESLIDNLCREETSKDKYTNYPVAERYLKNQLLRKKLTARAKDDAEGVFCDIQALTGITDVNSTLTGASLML